MQRVGSSVPSRTCAIFPTRDGYASVYVGPAAHFRAFLEWAGHPEELLDPRWLDRDYRSANHQVMDRHMRQLTAARTTAEVVREGQAHHITVGPVHSVAGFVESAHTRFRGFFTLAELSRIGLVRFPGPAYRFGASPWRLRCPAPMLGQHTQEVLAGEGGRGTGDSGRETLNPKPETRNSKPFDGVRILDLSRVWAGPFGTRYLGDLGAEVIRVETSQYPDGRPAGPFGWDLEYEHLRQERPDLIMVSQPGFGSSGPLRDFVAYGATVTSFSGMASLWAQAGAPGEVWCQISYPDFVAAAHAAVAMTAALQHRERTGEGQHIELAMVDAASATMGVAHLDYVVNGRVWQPQGNRSPHWAQNLYRCRGADRWCAIALTSDEEWERFCGVLGHPTWTKDQRFATNGGRLEHQDELDRRIEEWTVAYTPHQVMWLLQRAGVAAGAVQTGEDLFYDHHLRSRGLITQVDHGEVGLVTHAGLVVREEGRPRKVWRRAPLLGEHNEYVFGELLGLSSGAIWELAEAEVLV